MGFFKKKTPEDPRAAYLSHMEGQEEPWASFEIMSIEEGGRMKVEFNWNEPFIKQLKSMGFQAETDEDTVQLFFYASQMKPMGLAVGDDPVQSEAHPTLSSPQNVLMT